MHAISLWHGQAPECRDSPIDSGRMGTAAACWRHHCPPSGSLGSPQLLGPAAGSKISGSARLMYSPVCPSPAAANQKPARERYVVSAPACRPVEHAIQRVGRDHRRRGRLLSCVPKDSAVRSRLAAIALCLTQHRRRSRARRRHESRGRSRPRHPRRPQPPTRPTTVETLFPKKPGRST